jgi:hypothetical protein
MAPVARTVSVPALWERLSREIQQQEQLGAYAVASGIRHAITILLREADSPTPPQESQSLDPSS